MVLQKQVLRIPLAGGIDTKTAERHLQPGSASVSIENGILDKVGQIRKRYGFELNGGGAYSYSGGSGVMSGDALYLHRHYVNLSRNSTEGKIAKRVGTTETMIGECEPITYSVTPVSYGETQYIGTSNPDVAINTANNNIIVAWRDAMTGTASSAISYAVVDETTGAMLYEPRRFLHQYNPTQIRVTCVGASYCIFAALADLGTIGMFKFTDPAGTITSYSVCPIDVPCRLNAVTGSWAGNSCSVIAYVVTDAGSRYLRLSWVSTTGTVLHTETVAEPPDAPKTTTAIGLDRIGDVIFVSWVDNNDNLTYAAYYATNSGMVLEQTIADATGSCANCSRLTASADCGSIGTTKVVRLYAECLEVLPYDYHVRTYEIVYDTGSTIPTSTTRLRTLERVGIATKAISPGYTSRLWTWHDSGVDVADGVYLVGLQNCYMLERIERNGTTYRDRIVECQAMRGTASSYPSEVAPPASVVTNSDGEYCTAVLARKYEIREGETSNYYVDQVVLLRSRHDECDIGHVSRGDCAVIAGQPAILSSQHHTPIGYLFYPMHITASAGAGAGEMSDGTYRYQAFYEWIDPAGNLHRSAPSIPVVIELTGGTAIQSVDLTIPIIAAEVTHKLQSMRVVLYRTTASDPATYYRIGSTSAETDGTDTPYVGYTDTLMDADITDNSQPYTTFEQAAAGGELEANKPPHATIIAAIRDRIAVVPCEDRKTIWVSKPTVSGIATEFSEYITIHIESGGDIKAVAEMDGRIVVFKDSEIYILAGDGPGATGAGGWSLPERITTDIGCVSRHSVVRCERGLLFKSRRGIYLLDRSFQPSYIGAPVEYWNDCDIVASTIYTPLSQALFAAKSDSSTTILVYDYALNKWSTYTGQAPVSMVSHDGDLWYIASTGAAYKYESTTYRDGEYGDSTDVVMSVTLPWLTGYHRCWWVYVMGRWVNSHGVKVELSYDYDDTVIDTQTIAMATSTTEILRVMPSRQWSQAIKAKISVVATGDDELLEGAKLEAVEYHVGIGPERSWPVPQSRSV